MSNPNPLSRVRDVLVIGGGIAGCTVAYECARHGLTVTLLERHALAGHGSGRNMGLLLNQVEPEVVLLMQRALEIYSEAESAGMSFQLRRQDQMLIAADDAQMEATMARAEAMRGIGLDVQMVGADELRRELPALGGAVVGGARIPDARALDPAAATRAFAQLARESGAAILPSTNVADIEIASGRVQGILCDQGRLAADAVVIATGPWLHQLIAIPHVTAARGWVLLTDPLPFEMPWIVEEMSWPDQDELGSLATSPTLSDVARGGYDRPRVLACAVAPLTSGRALIGASMASSLGEAVEGVDMPRVIAMRALSILPGLAGAGVTASWYGMRPMTPDGMPIAGGCGADGLYVHGGHGSIGMMTAPATARWLVEAMTTGTAPPELGRFDPDRFSR